MINLFINWFVPPSIPRLRELEFALLKNLTNPLFNHIYVLESSPLPIWTTKFSNLVVSPYKGHPSYSTLFDYMYYMNNTNDRSIQDSINILANTDIYFDSTLLITEKMTRNTVYALSRWERSKRRWSLYKAGSLSRDSQDTWIFPGLPRYTGLFTDFRIGTPGCDNRIAHELSERYIVHNPAFTIKTYHVHFSNERFYKRGRDHSVPPPYRLLPAHR